MVAQHYFTIGPMYCVFWVVAFRGDKASPVWQSEQTRDNHPILFRCWASVEDFGSILEQHWVNIMCLLMPNMGSEAGLALNGIGWVGYTSCLRGTYRRVCTDACNDLVLHGCWPAPAMVVEGICLHIEDIIFVLLVLSLLIPWTWTFRILAHEEDQYSYVYKILSQFLCKAPTQTKAGPRSSGTPFLI